MVVRRLLNCFSLKEVNGVTMECFLSRSGSLIVSSSWSSSKKLGPKKLKVETSFFDFQDGRNRLFLSSDVVKGWNICESENRPVSKPETAWRREDRQQLFFQLFFKSSQDSFKKKGSSSMLTLEGSSQTNKQISRQQKNAFLCKSKSMPLINNK